VVLFLDEDCFLPRTTYLAELAKYHREHPDLAAGGLYLNKKTSTTSDQFYNFVCNTWVKSRQNLPGSPPVLLGGCCFYPLPLLKKHRVLFDDQNAKAGEEYLLNSRWTELGFSLILSEKWSVFHNPETSFYQVFKKSWIQGSQIDPRRASFNLQQVKKTCKIFVTEKDTKLSYLPMLSLYGTIGRASFLKTFALNYYNRYIHQTHKKRVSPPFATRSEQKGILAHDPLSRKHIQPNKGKKAQELILPTDTNILKKSVKIKPAEAIYKN
jgi:hypothetical protein